VRATSGLAVPYEGEISGSQGSEYEHDFSGKLLRHFRGVFDLYVDGARLCL
jgi:hypothetical protein